MNTSKSEKRSSLVCPFCGLLCSDVEIKLEDEQLIGDASLPDYCRHAYRLASLKDPSRPATLHGKRCSLDEAIKRAVQYLQSARRPLLVAGSMDVNAARAALKMASQRKAIISHITAAAFLRNLRVMQETGWIAATLNEPANRAELIVFIGRQLFDDYPRLPGRLMRKKRLYRDRPAEIIMLGDWQQADELPAGLRDCQPQIIRLKAEETANFLRRLAMHIKKDEAEEGQDEEAAQLARRLKEAAYSAIVWSSAELPPQFADLHLHSMAHCVRLLNKKTRCALVPVGSKDNNNTFAQVSLWTYGYPGELSFQRGAVDYDPYLFNWRRVLRQNEADLLIWVSPLKPELPPPAKLNTIALTHAGLASDSSLAVQIPTAIPGIDHGGHVHRLDNVVVMPLPTLRQSELPVASALLNQMLSLTAKIQ